MDIIIHGKPTAGSSLTTAGIDGSLSQKIVDDFFEGMNRIKDPQALIVEVRYWKNVWYSVYTYQLGVNIKDMANRTSFFALSLVIPQKYCCLVSEVHALLKRAIKETVAGSCIDSNGKYLIHDFNDAGLLNKVAAAVKSGYVNLEEDFDAAFKPQTELRNDIYYNVQDCDAKAFVQHLRTAGRIIVTENAETKDALLSNTNAYIQQCRKAQAELEGKTRQIGDLQEQIKKLNEEIASSCTSAGHQLDQFKKQVNVLTKEKSDLQAAHKTLNTKLESIAAVIGKVKEQKTEGPIPIPVKPEANWLALLPAVNTVLLVTIALIMVLSMKGCGDPQNIAEPNTSSQDTTEITGVETTPNPATQENQSIEEPEETGKSKDDPINQNSFSDDILEAASQEVKSPVSRPQPPKQPSKPENKVNSGGAVIPSPKEAETLPEIPHNQRQKIKNNEKV